MSVESVIAFFERIREDTSLSEKVAAIDRKDPEAAAGELIRIASEVGFDFTPEDLRRATDRRVSDDELEGAAGGRGRDGDVYLPP